MSKRYTAGWITVPGKGRRWRTTQGEYLMQRPAGDVLASAWRSGREALQSAGSAAWNLKTGVTRAVSPWASWPPVAASATTASASMLPSPSTADLKLLADSAGVVMNHALTGVSGRVVKAATNAITSSNPALTSVQLPRIVSSANKLLNTYGLPEVRLGEKSNYLQKVRRPTGSLIVHDYVPPSYNIRANVATTPSNAPGWIAAHELGHMVDLQRNPVNPDRANAAALTRRASGALPLLTRQREEERSLLEAGVQGALSTLGASRDTLYREFMADRYGKKIARDAGVPWSGRQNALAKATYAQGAITPGFVQGVAGEVFARGVDSVARNLHDVVIEPAARGLRGGPSSTERSLEQYGFNPEEYVIEGREGGGIGVRRRTPVGRLANTVRGWMQ